MIIRLVLCLLIFFPAAVNAADKAVPQNQQQLQLSFAPVVKQVAPAVVNIYTKRQVTVRSRSPFFNDPFFSLFMRDDMFGGMTRERVESSLGSGVITSADGLVVTNAHVIKGADEITVVLNDGREFSAQLKLQDDASDLALLRIVQPENLPYVDLKPSEGLEVGDIVLAIGNPFGVGQTVTSGIVSAQGRSTLDINDFNFFIQTDAAINPGNSGGALVTLDGKVVGINTAIYSRDGGSLGIGFAIPSEMVASVIAAEAMGQSGVNGIVRAWLGVTAQTVTADIAESLGLETPRGVLIAGLHSQSPLRKAGIRIGDVVVSMNDKALRDPSEMKFRMATIPLGDQASVEVLRAGNVKTCRVKAMAAPDKPDRDTTVLQGRHPLSGATIVNVNPAVAVELGLDEEQEGRVVVINVSPRSASARIVRPGSLLLEINGKAIENVDDAYKILKRGSNQGWSIVIESQGRIRRIVSR